MNTSAPAGVVLVTGTQTVPPMARAYISERGFDLRLIEKDDLNAAELHEELVGVRGYIIGGEEEPQVEHFERTAQQLEVVAFVGTDYRKYVPGWGKAVELGIAVASTPGENAISVAEFTVLLMLAIARPFIADIGLVGSGGIRSSAGTELYGRTLGIIGAGRIGARVARIAATGLGMKVLYTAPRRNEALEAALGVEYTGLADLLKRSHVVSLHRPGSGSGELPVLGRSELELFREGAILINTIHADLVDLDGLLWAIDNRGVRAAFDGVGEGDAWSMLAARGPERFLCVPQMGYRTGDAGLRAGERAARAVCDVLEGKASDSVSNPDFRQVRRQRIAAAARAAR